MAVLRTERGLDRLVNFSDAAVAIAITLLILPLVDLAGDIGEHETFGDFLSDHLGSFIAFFVTFFVIGRFWMVHHRVFEFVSDYSTALIWLNLLWLVSIVFLPFPANSISGLPSESGSFYAVYIGTMSVMSATMVAIELLLRRHPELMREDARGVLALGRGVATTTTLLVAGILAFLLPTIGLFWLLLLFLSGPLEALLVRVLPGLRSRA